MRPQNGGRASWKNPNRPRKVGEETPSNKLTEEQAKLILAAPNERGIPKILAAHFGVSITLICYIQKRQAWRYLPPATPEEILAARNYVATLSIN